MGSKSQDRGTYGVKTATKLLIHCILMTYHLTLFLACFQSILVGFGTFVMFSIFESVILFFPKHTNFREGFEVIHEEIRQSKTFKDYWALRR